MDSSKRLVSQKKREPRLAVRAVKGTLFSTEGGREGGQRQNVISEVKKEHVFLKEKPLDLTLATFWHFCARCFQSYLTATAIKSSSHGYTIVQKLRVSNGFYFF